MWWCYGFLSIWRVDPSARQPCLHRMATMPTCPVCVLGMHSWLKRTPPPAWIFHSVSSGQTPWHFFCDKCQGSSPLLPQSKCLKQGLAATVAALAQQVEGLMAKINTNAGPSSLHAGLEHESHLHQRSPVRTESWPGTEVGLDEALSDHMHHMTLYRHQG